MMYPGHGVGLCHLIKRDVAEVIQVVKRPTATTPVYLNTLSGKGVMLVTTNDYLASVIRKGDGIYEFLEF